MGKHSLLALLGSVALSGCDGHLRIRGETPDSEPCIVALIDSSSGRAANTFTVSGSFTENVFFPGAWRAPSMSVTAQCGGKLVKTVQNPSFPELNLGKLGNEH